MGGGWGGAGGGWRTGVAAAAGVVLCCAATGWAGEGNAARWPRVLMIDGSVVQAEVVAWDAEGAALRRGGVGTVRRVPAEQIVAVEFREPSQPEEPVSAGWLALTDGTVLRGRAWPEDAIGVVGGGAGGRQSEGFVWGGDDLAVPAWVPLGSAAWLVSESASGDWSPAKVAVVVREQGGAEDVALLGSGDRVEGTILGFAPGSLQMVTALGVVSVSRELVDAVVWRQSEEPGTEGVRVRAWLAGGSRVEAARAEVGGDVVVVRCASGAELRLRRERVVRVEYPNRRWVYLSDLAPAGYEQVSYGSVRWPWVADRNVRGGLLQLGGRVYARGVGVHSRAVLRYALEGGYERFRAVVGVDDSAGPAGAAAVRVVVDGQTRWAEDGLKAGSSPRAVDVDVRGARTLELVTDYGPGGDVQDVVDWAEAGLVRAAGR